MEQVQIPEKALLQGEKDSYVYVRQAPEVFVRRPVEVRGHQKWGSSHKQRSAIGDEVIIEGGYYLK
jgi:cobalt-zinc-cadmium efflux system membrane fusion protein